MSSPRTFKLLYKIVALVVVIVAAIAAASYVVSATREERIKREEQELQMYKMANIIASLKLIEPVTGRNIDWGIYQKFVDVTGSLDPDIVAIAVMDGANAIKAYWAEENRFKAANPQAALDLKSALRAAVAQGKLRSKEGDLVTVDSPITVDNRPVALIRIVFSQTRMKEDIARNRRTSLNIALGVLGLGILGGIVLARGVTRPLENLAGKMQKVAAGDFSERMTSFPRDEVGMLARTFNGMVDGLVERDRIKAERDRLEVEKARYRETLQRYVSRQVADRILSEHGSPFLKGERRDVTILFSDIRGFTRMSERMQPEEVVLLLNEYFSLMIDIVFKYDGMLDKFIGDCVMAVFGAPEGHPDDAIRAVRTALEMRDAVRRFNDRRAKEGKEMIQAGIGINSGQAVAGSIGSQERMEYTVIGDNVNLASRLTSNAVSGQILISEQTYKKVGNYIRAAKLPSIHVKGKDALVDIYEIEDLAAAETVAMPGGGQRQ